MAGAAVHRMPPKKEDVRVFRSKNRHLFDLITDLNLPYNNHKIYTTTKHLRKHPSSMTLRFPHPKPNHVENNPLN